MKRFIFAALTVLVFYSWPVAAAPHFAVKELGTKIVFGQGTTGTTVIFSWGASTTPGVTYDLFRELTPGACTSTSVGTGPGCTKVNTIPITTLTSTDSTPVPDVKSFYVVRAFNPVNSRVSPFSNEVTVDLTAPAPITLTCQVTMNGTVLTGLVCK